MIGHITIYTPEGAPLLETTLQDDSRYQHALSSPEQITLRFQRALPLSLPYGAYVLYQEVRWELLAPYTPEMEDGLVRYELTLYRPSGLIEQVAMLYSSAGQAVQVDFDLTDSLEAHARLVEDNLNRRLSTSLDTPPWRIHLVGVRDEGHKHIAYHNLNALEALGKITEAWGCYWWAEGREIYLGKHPEAGEVVEIRLGEVAQRISRQGTPRARIGRLYAFGSSRNLPPSYRDKRLCLPVEHPYVTLGDDQAGGAERVEVFDDVYPHYIGQVERVERQTTGEQELFVITDQGIQIHREHLLPGTPLMMSFVSGALRGMHFEVQILPGQGYRIVPNETYGKLLPAGLIRPEAGDRYIPYGFDISLVGTQYIPQAEQALLRRATQWLDEQGQSGERIEVVTNPTYMHEHQLRFALGDRVRLTLRSESAPQIGTVARLEYPLSMPSAQSLTITEGRPVQDGVLGRVLAQAETQRQRLEHLSRTLAERQSARELYVEYSVDGEHEWHSLPSEQDRFIRQRVGAQGIWSPPLRLRGEDVLQVQVWSQSGAIFLNGAVETTLVAFVYRGREDISDTLPPTAYRWTRQSSNPATDAVWNALNASAGRSLRLTPSDVDRTAHFVVSVNDERL